jgi:large repetitive protein
VKGTKFVNVSEVDFNGLAGDNLVVGPAPGTSLTVKVPTGATTGPITVVNDKGDGTSKASFLVVDAPIINSFTPTAGKPRVGTKVGTTVTITGTSFIGTTNVTFNGTPAPGFKVTGNTKITATVPAGATTGPIVVTNASGDSDPSDDFNVITAVPAPTSTDVSSGGFGTAVVITGTNLDDATGVTFNGKAATFTNVSSTEIDTVVPVGAMKGHGTGAKAGIQVTNVFGTSASVDFNVLDTAPTLTTVKNGTKVVTSGFVGDTITLGGTHLDTVTEVDFGAGSQSTITHTSATSISVVVPGGATNGVITALNPDGSGSTKTSFTILATPVIVGFSPAYGKAGTKVTIVGSHFAGATEVDFGSSAAKVKPTLNKDGSLSAVVPANVVTGPITVRVGALSSDSGNDWFTKVVKPTINTSGNPTTAARGATITLAGTGFTGTTSVKVGTLVASYSVASGGASIDVHIPSTAKLGANQMITIANSAGSATYKLTITP